MKKRLLITSIVMMLVVAVALSTATYAWFTSNARVEASSINLTAATSSAPAFGISWTGNDDYSTALEDIVGPSAGFNPLVPATYSTSSTDSDVIFATATMRQEGGAEKYNTDVLVWSAYQERTSAERATNYNVAAKPYIWNNGSVNSFWIKNLSTSIDQSHLYASATVTGAAADMVRIAIFDTGDLKGILAYNYTYSAVAAQAEYSSTTTYYKAVTGGYLPDATVTSENFAEKITAGIFTRAAAPVVAPTYYGTIAANAPVLTTNSNSSLSIDLGGFTALQAREITVYVWLDGKYLNDDTQNTEASIDLVFTSTDPYAVQEP